VTEQLIRIGKFGNEGGAENSMKFRITSRFQPPYLSLSEFFIILDDDRIRFFMAETVALNDKELILTTEDRDLVKEVKQSKQAWLALDSETISTITEPENRAVGMHLVFKGENIGTVIHVFNNKAHDILVAETEEGKEIMIPDVSEFVLEKDFLNGLITVHNVEDLLLL
jgi:ribosomal 30S subunit maturation factor RimM